MPAPHTQAAAVSALLICSASFLSIQALGSLQGTPVYVCLPPQHQQHVTHVPYMSRIAELRIRSTPRTPHPAAHNSGMNLFVEADEYDPLAPHRKHNEDTDKGEGMSFMFTLFSCCSPAVKKFPEPAATSDRHVSDEPSLFAAASLSSSAASLQLPCTYCCFRGPRGGAGLGWCGVM